MLYHALLVTSYWELAYLRCVTEKWGKVSLIRRPLIFCMAIYEKVTLTCFRSYVVYGFSFLALGSLLMNKYQTFLGSFWSDCFVGVTFLAKVNSFIIISTCGFLLTGRACHVWLDGTHYRSVGEVAYEDWRRLLSIVHKDLACNDRTCIWKKCVIFHEIFIERNTHIYTQRLRFGSEKFWLS